MKTLKVSNKGKEFIYIASILTDAGREMREFAEDPKNSIDSGIPQEKSDWETKYNSVWTGDSKKSGKEVFEVKWTIEVNGEIMNALCEAKVLGKTFRFAGNYDATEKDAEVGAKEFKKAVFDRALKQLKLGRNFNKNVKEAGDTGFYSFVEVVVSADDDLYAYARNQPLDFDSKVDDQKTSFGEVFTAVTMKSKKKVYEIVWNIAVKADDPKDVVVDVEINILGKKFSHLESYYLDMDYAKLAHKNLKRKVFDPALKQLKLGANFNK